MPARAIIDIDGSDAVTAVLLNLLNQFPGLPDGRCVEFATLADDSGIAFYPTAGAVLTENREDILGHVFQVCVYPFDIRYRGAPRSETQRMRFKEFLDTFGKWLELQPVAIGEQTVKLSEYPELSSGNRKIRSIARTTPGYLNAAYQSGAEDWVISAVLSYENEYDK